MKNSIETVYVLENPQKKITKFATGSQLRNKDIIKEVFGVACIDDLRLMIQFNKSFQDSICNHNGISENKISLRNILRVASKMDLLQLKEQLIKNVRKDVDVLQENVVSIPRPFNSMIKLQEGIFSWDAQNSSYNSVNQGA
ncbi:hypothetical protein NDK43_08500 [Neobacillus pocheonensis]|uniref:Uncharacterized protein n=1 Tax=Neobacillus pocheonensis TaxID=363869 RepID=A0ABT0W7Y9_9BACI|nr:hypothetical protein [Neobacillus pocheonensis]